MRRIQQTPEVAADVLNKFYETAAAVGLIFAGAYTFVKTKATEFKEKLSLRKTRPEEGNNDIEPMGALDFSP